MLLQHAQRIPLPTKQPLPLNLRTRFDAEDHQFDISDYIETETNCSSPGSSVSCQTSISFNDFQFDTTNPYRTLIDQCQTPAEMTDAYENHRRSRNASKNLELHTTHTVTPDPILAGLVLDNQPPEFDPRNCITIWGRPPSHVMDLIGTVQSKLVGSINPHLTQKQPTTIPKDWQDMSNKGPLWLMPRECLHLSALEINHTVPVQTVLENMELLRPYLNELLNPIGNAPVLMRPLVCFDSSALALTFVPINCTVSHKRDSRGVYADDKDAQYSYTHYRASLYETVTKVAGVNVESRYQVPSAHVTIARFIQKLSPEAIDSLLAEIEKLNVWLDAEYSDPSKFAWRIGQERATECRYGRIWYGGGISEGEKITLDSYDF